MNKAKELLKKIGVTNDIKEIKEFELIYENAIEKSYKIVTEIGEIDFRIIDLKNLNKKVSKLDYFDIAYTFNRNVNLPADF